MFEPVVCLRMSDLDENIFLKAALKGEITQPSSLKGKWKENPRKKAHRYSHIEDLILVRKREEERIEDR